MISSVIDCKFAIARCVYNPIRGICAAAAVLWLTIFPQDFKTAMSNIFSIKNKESRCLFANI